MKKTVILKKWKKLEKKLISKNSKLLALGYESTLEWSAGEIYTKELPVSVIFDNDETLRSEVKMIKTVVEVVDITFTGELPSVGDWKVVKVLERTSDGVISYSIEDDFKHDSQEHDFKRCDHCNNKVNRKYSTIVRNTAGELKTIGKSCLKDFVNTKNIETVMNIIKFLDTIDTRDKFDESYYQKGYDLLLFVSECAQNIIEFNYKNSYTEGPSTKDMVMSGLGSNVITDDARAMAVNAIDRALNFTDAELENEFNMNLHIIAKQAFITERHLGLASYLPEFYRREEVKQKIKEAKIKELKSNEHVGEIKSRVEFELIYTGTRSYTGQYNTAYFHSFVDKKGNLIIWKGTTNLCYAFNDFYSPAETVTNDDLIGKTLKLIGTISKHDEFNNRNQTYINRCKFLKEVV